MRYSANSVGRMSKMGCQESASKADRSRETAMGQSFFEAS